MMTLISQGFPMKQFLILLFIFFHSCSQHENSKYNKPDQLDDGIQTSTLTDVGMDEQLIHSIEDSITTGGYPNIHSVLILRNNKLVYEKYWPGHDENRGTDFVGIINHHRDSLHDIRSITKSITSAAVMIALEQGKIKHLDQRLFDFFPEFSKYAQGSKKNITIRHLLTMTSGLNWLEEQSYNDSMKKHDVAYALDFILRQPQVNEPGSKFSYNSGSTQLLGQIIEKATGMNIEKFIVKHLFEPLKIKDFEWTKERNGLIGAWGGLRMRSRDMMKFGMLYMNDGKWNGKQIISDSLVNESIRTHVFTDEPNGYGYQFWTWVDSVQDQQVHTIEASGNGGQKIEINRSKNLVLVITAGNYDLHNLRKTPYDLYLDFVYPAVIK
jgi:CubicO group peptidase (beta-lactamase class C family)